MRPHRNGIIDRDRQVRDAVLSLPPALREKLLEALILPPEERARQIGHLHRDPTTCTFAELLIDLEADRQLALDFAQELKERVR